MRPRIRIAWRDGFALAYQVVGDGDGDVLYLPGFESNVDRMWDVPAYRAFLERLAGLGRLITHDRRGLGCSDRLPPGEAVTLDESRDDLIAVLDAASSRRVGIVAVQEAVFPTLLLAATHPERLAWLVLFGATPSYSSSEELPDGWTADQWEEQHTAWERVTDLTSFLDEHARNLAPSLAGDAPALAEVRSLLANTVGLGAAVAESRMLSGVDVRSVLPSVTCPVLVLRRADDETTSPTAARYLADHIAAGEFVEIPGRDALPWVGDTEPLMDAIERFVGADRR